MCINIQGSKSGLINGWHMGVSKNSGTPKWMVYNGKSLLKWMIWGYLYFRKHPYQSTGFAGLQISGALLSIQPPQFLRSRGKLFPPFRWAFCQVVSRWKGLQRTWGCLNFFWGERHDDQLMVTWLIFMVNEVKHNHTLSVFQVMIKLLVWVGLVCDL